MQNIVQESQIFGPVYMYKNYLTADKILLEASENFQKKSFRNRYKILAANGPLTLSIPLIKGKNQKTNIKKVKIAYYQPWYTNHIHSIRSAYGNAPFFIYYADEIFKLLRSKEQFLFDLNKKAQKLILDFLSIDIQFEETIVYNTSYPGHCDLRNTCKINSQNPENSMHAYTQVFEDKFDFVSGLSILDLLFNLGPESRIHLNTMAKASK